jgi:hypothetical protein
MKAKADFNQVFNQAVKEVKRKNGAPYDGSRSKTKKLVPEKSSKKLMTQANIVNRHEHGMTIDVHKLPVSCKHREYLLPFIQKDAKICVIACRRGNLLKWVAYAGYPNIVDLLPNLVLTSEVSTLEWSCEHVNDVEGVKMLGEVLERNVAEILFPDWDISLYTERE